MEGIGGAPDNKIGGGARRRQAVRDRAAARETVGEHATCCRVADAPFRPLFRAGDGTPPFEPSLPAS